MAITAFSHLLTSANLLPYRGRLLENGFDDIETLSDMTEADMRTIGIPLRLRKVLEWLLADVRWQTVAAAQTDAGKRSYHLQTRV